MRNLLLIWLSFWAVSVSAQGDDDAIKAAMQLPEFTISADDDFDAEDFMRHVLSDSSFYQAFINLKYIPHSFEGNLRVQNKKDKEKATIKRTSRQTLENGYQVVTTTREETTGKVYNRKGDHRYLTAEMWDEVFYPKTPQLVSPTISRFEQIESKESKLDKYKSQLKKMMFNPGQEIVSVPFIGDKMDIFAPDMAKLYDFSVYSAYTPDSVYCYVFRVDAKEEYRPDRTVIKNMVSYFDKADLQVVSREYVLENNTLLFEFDIWMKVENELRNGLLLPRRIQYNGDWDIPFKSAEIIQFDISCTDYDTSVLR